MYISQEEWGQQGLNKRMLSQDMEQETYDNVDMLGKSNFSQG